MSIYNEHAIIMHYEYTIEKMMSNEQAIIMHYKYTIEKICE